MKTEARVVVIGGGVVGCSVLYHLAKAGWTDVMLIERSELTSGSSWHAAGGFHTLNGDPNVAKLQAYTVGLYKELEAISGQSCSLHLTGGVMMADSPERMDFLRLVHAKGRCLGMETEIITPSEAKAMFPLMDETQFVGALWDPVEGHLDPSGTTHAYAKAAQKLGATIVLRNRVVELTQGRTRLERGHRAGHGARRACGQRRRALGARGWPDGRHRTAAAGHGAHVSADRAHARGRGVQPGHRPRARRRHRLQGRDLHPAGARRHAARHLREGLRAVVAGRPRPGISATNCCHPISTASRPRSRSASATSRRSRTPGSGR
jgi:glycine/D-amino acid oxidase-like deaminating enzyme